MNRENELYEPLDEIEELGGIDEPLPMPTQRSRMKTVALGLLILVSGMVIGSGLTMGFLWKRLEERVRRPEMIPDHIMTRINDELGLTPEQRDEIRMVFENHIETIGKLRRELMPKIREEMELLRNEIDSILTPEQAAIWNERFKNLESRWLGPPDRGGRRGGGAPPSDSEPRERRRRGGEGMEPPPRE